MDDLEDLAELGDLEDQIDALLLQVEAEEALKNSIFNPKLACRHFASD